jgi:uncharacterized membrane protein YhaH (DUF805 family)
VKSLFSFKGEISRGEFWAINIGSALVHIPVLFVELWVGIRIGAPLWGFDGPDWSRTPADWAMLAIFGPIELAFYWVPVAALIKRLRDVGIALKWLALFAVSFAIAAATTEWLVGDPNAAPVWKIAVMFAAMAPTIVLGFWLLGSACFVSSYKSNRVDLDKLPEGWNK